MSAPSPRSPPPPLTTIQSIFACSIYSFHIYTAADYTRYNASSTTDSWKCRAVDMPARTLLGASIRFDEVRGVDNPAWTLLCFDSVEVRGVDIPAWIFAWTERLGLLGSAETEDSACLLWPPTLIYPCYDTVLPSTPTPALLPRRGRLHHRTLWPPSPPLSLHPPPPPAHNLFISYPVDTTACITTCITTTCTTTTRRSHPIRCIVSVYLYYYYHHQLVYHHRDVYPPPLRHHSLPLALFPTSARLLCNPPRLVLVLFSTAAPPAIRSSCFLFVCPSFCFALISVSGASFVSLP
ncbi:hypothetical protein B0H17DRAFT_1205361 [Mycena rosella]|uniref:Uncharacterized protein n=1 Tax=Mycena rosella TaxID=1033263 RepID=A0AAD7GA62_MYCRO|nr:hypothetical protein B0H17DRAFT_1205361 [Mycena rosella]